LRVKTVRSSRPGKWVLFACFSSCGLLFCLLLLISSSQLSSVALASPAFKLKPNDPYALIFGTVWGPDNHPVYGVRVKIRRASDKKAKWELYSDHAGEFAQRVPAGEADYVIWADLKGVKTTDGQILHLAQEVAIHVQWDERVDMSLHLTH
jgi:alpha-beta hydrolase superfamily lysophospholipase